MSLPVFPANGSLMHGASLPSSGSQRAWFPVRNRYYEGATTSRLRISGRLFCSLPLPTRSSSFVSDVALLKERRSPPGPGDLGAGCPYLRLLRVDASGISQVSRRSFLCLCSAPRPRSSRCALAMAVTSMLPPLPIQRRLRTTADFGAHSRSFGTCSPTLRVSRCHSRARLASGWLAGLYREGVEPSGPRRKVSDR
jgi:hypothetical protein